MNTQLMFTSSRKWPSVSGFYGLWYLLVFVTVANLSVLESDSCCLTLSNAILAVTTWMLYILLKKHFHNLQKQVGSWEVLSTLRSRTTLSNALRQPKMVHPQWMLVWGKALYWFAHEFMAISSVGCLLHRFGIHALHQIADFMPTNWQPNMCSCVWCTAIFPFLDTEGQLDAWVWCAELGACCMREVSHLQQWRTFVTHFKRSRDCPCPSFSASFSEWWETRKMGENLTFSYVYPAKRWTAYCSYTKPEQGSSQTILLTGLCSAASFNTSVVGYSRPFSTAPWKPPLGDCLKQEHSVVLKEEQCLYPPWLSVSVHAQWPSWLPSLCLSWMPRDTTMKRVMAAVGRFTALLLLKNKLPAPKPCLMETSKYPASCTTGAKQDTVNMIFS